MEEKDWILLNYTLPKDPSRIRVSIWRKLKKNGSVSIGQSIWLLPYAKEHIDFYSDIAVDILHNSGEAFILKASFIGDKKSEDIIEIFNKARDEEYREVLEKCEDFFHEIEKEIKRENYTFAEIEENEYEYNKLTEWHRDIVKRDFFHAPLQSVAEKELGRCKQELDDFSKRTYDTNNEIY